VEQNQAAIGRAVRRSRRQVGEGGRIEGLDESEWQAGAAGHDRERRSGEREEVRTSLVGGKKGHAGRWACWACGPRRRAERQNG